MRGTLTTLRPRHLRCSTGAALVLALFALASLRTPAGEGYALVELPDFGGNFGRARQVNQLGLVVGEALTPGPDVARHAAQWAFGSVSDLEGLGGMNSSANAVNAGGLIGGWAQDAEEHARPTLWQDGAARALPVFGGNNGAVWGLNDLGIAVGQASRPDGAVHAALWSGPGIQDLGTLGGSFSVAYEINNAGLIAGSAADVADSERAVLWDAGQIVDLGGLSGGQWTAARDVNEAGNVILWGVPEGGLSPRAVLWSGATGSPVVELGTFGGAESWAYGLNNAGAVVGWADTPDGVYHAFVWDGVAMTDLGTLGGLYSAAYGINDDGIIVGAAQDSTGVTRPVAWVPVPEPSPTWLFLFGLAWMWLARSDVRALKR